MDMQEMVKNFSEGSTPLWRKNISTDQEGFSHLAVTSRINLHRISPNDSLLDILHLV